MRFARRTKFFFALEHSPHVTHRRALAVALPIMASNVSEPLIGIVDTAVIGQLPEAHYIGAIAVGALIFSFVYWGFGFLRMGTGGLAAQACGAGDDQELRHVLGRSLLIAIVLGIAIVLLHPLLERFAFSLIEGSDAVEEEAAIYFQIRIWSAPFALASYVMLGWFIGIGNTRIAFAIQIFLNVTNMLLDAGFVLGLGMKADGVGLGTLIAEILAALLGLYFVQRELRRRGGGFDLARMLDRAKLKRTFVINGDIMLRNLALTGAFWWFTAQGAKTGDSVLAANAILMHFFTLVSCMLDGFAYAVEALAGQAVGARSRERFRAAVRITSIWAIVVALFLGGFILLVGGWGIDLLSSNDEVRRSARIHLGWAALTPLCGAIAFQMDGIFVGATQTRDMRNMMAVCIAIYLAAWWLLTPAYGNHGLWAALVIFLLARGVTLMLRLPALERTAFGGN